MFLCIMIYKIILVWMSITHLHLKFIANVKFTLKNKYPILKLAGLPGIINSPFTNFQSFNRLMYGN